MTGRAGSVDTGAWGRVHPGGVRPQRCVPLAAPLLLLLLLLDLPKVTYTANRRLFCIPKAIPVASGRP